MRSAYAVVGGLKNNLGMMGPRSWVGGWLTPKHIPPYIGLHTEFGSCWSNGRSKCMDDCLKKWAPLIPPFKDTQGHQK